MAIQLNGDEKTSQIFQDFLKHLDKDTFTLSELSDALKQRSFGLLLLILALPNALLLAVVPMVSTFFGVLLIFVSLQLIFRQKTLWLPKKIAHYSMTKSEIEKIYTKCEPLLLKAEKLLKARFSFLTSFYSEPILGIVCLIHAIIIALPIPLGNVLPGTTLIILALGLIEKDGLFIIIGYILSAGVFAFFATSFWVLFLLLKNLLF
jgi:hypothetical protein